MRSLRQRNFVTFALFSVFLAILFTTSVISVLLVAEDSVLETQLNQEGAKLHRKIARGIRPSLSPPFAVYYLDGSIPPELRFLKMLPAGHYEVDVNERDLMVLITKGNGPVSTFLVYDVSALEVSNLPRGRFIFALVALFSIGIIVAGLILGAFLSKRAVVPLRQLALRIEGATQETLEEALTIEKPDEEIAFLVNELRTRIHQLRQFAQREEQFTRYASHELRSPVAVIKGATELMRHLIPEEGQNPPLERIERAVADMESIIECFLWLARDQVQHESPPKVIVSPLVHTLATRYEYLSTAKDLHISVVGEAYVAAPNAVLKIVIGNLLANAIHFTEEGEIKISLSSDRISVQDTGSGLSGSQMDTLTQDFVRGESSNGYGLGLAIVRSLCERFGWRLTLRNLATRGAIATIELPHA